jgi:hypothetical protein
MAEMRNAQEMLDQAEGAAIAGDLASADRLLRDAARIQEAALGPLHPDLAKTLNNLGIIAERTGRPGDAEAFYRRAAAIASASLPSGDPMVADTRKTLEDFCRERGLPIDVPVDIPLSVPRMPTPTASPPLRPALDRTSRPLAWVAIGVVALVTVALLVRWGSSSSSEAPSATPAAAPTAQQAVEPPPPPPTQPAPIEQAQPPVAAPRGSSRGTGTSERPAPTRSAVAISLATAELCQTLSTSGGNWRCDPVGDPVSPRPIVFYTRVKSPRDTAVVHRWYRGNSLRQSAKLTIRANASEGYRTYSRFSVDVAGDWRVEVRSMDDDLLYERRFAVR